ncbi:CIC11C00000005809 [Sungouiella intermedia]|uniref:Ribosomal lysine N-methyltransferase 5 n=1 Tax=Sungouiella intermedia TaxID=45354 RepID=A0A1L0C794_9ASCO|nr:CIC11C00000005809 [[Candida] intermedia]
MDLDVSNLQKVVYDDLYEHLFHIYVEHKPSEQQHLGYVDKSTDLLEISLPKSKVDLTIQQSLASLSSATESSSTGFICWQGAVNFADWVLANPNCPFGDLFKAGSSISVLELGAGVGAVLASVFGPNVSSYVATDQKHVLKLMKSNFANNVVSQRYSSSTSVRTHDSGPKKREGESWGTIEFLEFDWEHLEAGASRYHQIIGQECPDVILASDTIYNGHLISFFVRALKQMMGPHTLALVTIQLRDEDVTEEFFLEIFSQHLELLAVPDELLDDKLIEGFMVYCIRKAG